MTYYCGHCLLKKRLMVKTIGKQVGLVNIHICPICKHMEPLLTKEEVLYAYMKYMEQDSQSTAG